MKKGENMINPLLSDWSKTSKLPPYDTIDDSHFEQAIDKAMNSQNSVILGSQYVKGNIYITSSNQDVILHVCFKDSWGNDANKTGVTISVD